MIRIGTRGSALARWQTAHVGALLRAHEQDLQIEEEVIVTRGDVDMRAQLPLAKLEKGFFTLELQDALRAGRIDCAVHSLKDLPTKNASGLALRAIDRRANPADLLIARKGALAPGAQLLEAGARVGASSLRRQAQLQAYAPHVVPMSLRGNVPTRVSKLREGSYDAIVIAAAGIERLGLDLSDLSVLELNPRIFLPAPGQGALGLEAREDDRAMLTRAEQLVDAATDTAVGIERRFLSVLEGGCTTPFGAYAEADRVTLGCMHEGAWRALTAERPRRHEDYVTCLARLHASPPQEVPEDDWLSRQK